MSRNSISPIHAARVLHTDLCAHRRLVPVAHPPTCRSSPANARSG